MAKRKKSMISKALIDSSSVFLFEEASVLGLQPKWETKFGLFSFLHKGNREFIYHTKLHLNSQLGSWICKNKQASHIILEEHGLPTIPYCRPASRLELYKFFDRYKLIIKKPVAGMQSEDVSLISVRTELDTTSMRKYLFEQYIVGTEYRYLVLKGKIIAVQEKKIIPTKKDPWNPSVMNLPESSWDHRAISIALKIASLLHMEFMAVDFILDTENVFNILEINDTPSVHFFHKPHKGVAVNVSKILLEEVYLRR